MFRPLTIFLLLCAFALSLGNISHAAPSSTEPDIVLVKGKVVLVHVPDGFAAVHLQVLTAPPKGRALAGQRAARPQWRTVDGKKVNGNARYVRLAAPALTPARYLRVYGVRPREIAPELVTSETTAFGPDLLGEVAPEPSGGNFLFLDRAVSLGEVGGIMNFAMASNSAAMATVTPTLTRTVTESDIWKIDGDRLYFFNSARGLQILDIANPDDPAMLGTLRLQGAGEQMYLLDPSHVVMLTNHTEESRGWSWSDPVPTPSGIPNRGVLNIDFVGGGVIGGGILNGGVIALNRQAVLAVNAVQGQVNAVANIAAAPAAQFSGPFGIIFGPTSGRAADEHSVVVVEVRNGVPHEIARVPFSGALRESRLVGQVLYLCTHTYADPEDAGTPVLNVISFDLSDPENPVQRGLVSFAGSEAAVYATDRYFFVAPASLTVSTSVYSTYAVPSTKVQVVDISDPTGSISLAGTVPVRGFVRDKFKMNLNGDIFTAVGQDSVAPQPGYNSYYSQPVSVVSTFSLANPNAPVALGMLEVAPGEALFATRYVGTRLYLVTTTPQYVDPLAIIELSDPAKPTIIGELHVPGYSTYIEPIGDRLVTTGMQNHTAKVEMYDISNPAAPTQISSLALGAPESGVNSEALTNEKAFTVLPEQGLILLPVAAHAWNGEGATGVQIIDLLETGLVKRGVISSGMSTRRSTVHKGRIVSISATKFTAVNAADRDQPVVTADVDLSWNVEQVLLVDGHLIELIGSGAWPELVVAPANQPDAVLHSLPLPTGEVVLIENRGGVLYVVQRRSDGWSSTTPLTLSAIDLAHLPKLTLLGQATSVAQIPTSYGSDIRPVWVNDRTLLLSMTRYQSGQVRPLTGADPAKADSIQPIGSFNARSRALLAVDVTVPAKPKFVSDLTVGQNRSWTVGPAVGANDTVYVSYKVAPHNYFVANGAELDPDPEQADRHKYYLKQIDYSDSAHPVVSAGRVNIPGELRALSRQASLLYTVGAERDPASGDALNKDFALHASSFDGSVVHLLGQVTLSGTAQPFTVSGETVFLFDPQPEQVWVPDAKPPTKPKDGTNPVGSGMVLLSTSISSANIGTYQPNPKKTTLSTWEVSDDGKFVRRDSLTLDREVAFKQFGGLTVARSAGPSVRFIDSRDPQALHDLGVKTIDATGTSSLERSAGDLDRGLWLPLCGNGVVLVPIGR